MKPVMYLFANKGLGMSPGKMSAQVAHAAVEAYQTSHDALAAQWNRAGYTKLVMEARDTEHLRNIQMYLMGKGFESVAIIDEGRTETAPHSFTALGVPIVDKDDPAVQFAFGDFVTFKAPKREKSRLKRLRQAW